MIAIAKNLGEAPLHYVDELRKNDDGTVTAVKAGQNLSQQPTAGRPYDAAYGLFEWSANDGPWERAEQRGQILTYTVNGEKFGYVWF